MIVANDDDDEEEKWCRVSSARVSLRPQEIVNKYAKGGIIFFFLAVAQFSEIR